MLLFVPQPPRRHGSVYGPYWDKRKRRFRVVEVTPAGSRKSTVFATERQAARYIEIVRADAEAAAITVGDMITKYLAHQTLRGLKDSTVTTLGHRLRSMLPDPELYLLDVTNKYAQHLYDELCGKVAVDTHRNTLIKTRSFFAWLVKREYVRDNPWTEVEGIGRRRTGKEQLTRDEARRLLVYAQAAAGDDAGALATLVTLLLGLRASEVVSIGIRDIDDGGRLLLVRGTKSRNAVRTVAVPDLLAPCLEGRTGHIFGAPRSRYWLRHAVARICREAGVPVVTPHGLRGTHASLATAAGATSELVAAQLGHGSTAVTERHYSSEDSQGQRQQRAALTVLDGGK